jgi:hypothetical protein
VREHCVCAVPLVIVARAAVAAAVETAAPVAEPVTGFARPFDILAAKYRGGDPVNDRDEATSSAAVDEDAFTEEDFGHPRGTLAIVLIYALIFAFSWAGLYVWQFLERGAPTH